MSDEEKPEATAEGEEEENQEEAEEQEDGAEDEEAAGSGEEEGEGDEEDGEEKEEGEEGDDGETRKEGCTGVKERIEKDPLELEFLTPLPELIKFIDIPRINDAKSVWRLGMRKIEECFAEHIANMHIDFEDKARQYEHIQC